MRKELRYEVSYGSSLKNVTTMKGAEVLEISDRLQMRELLKNRERSASSIDREEKNNLESRLNLIDLVWPNEEVIAWQSQLQMSGREVIWSLTAVWKWRETWVTRVEQIKSPEEMSNLQGPNVRYGNVRAVITAGDTLPLQDK